MDTTFPIKETILRLGDVRARTGLSRSTIYAWMSADQFPKAISLGARSSGWLESEIDFWINQQIQIARS